VSNWCSAGLRHANIALVMMSIEKRACLCLQTGIPNNGVQFGFAVEEILADLRSNK